MALAEIAATDTDIKEILESSLGHVEAAEQISQSGFATTEMSVRRYRKKIDWEPPIEEAPPGWSKEAEIDPEGNGTLCSGPLEAPITDPAELLKLWNMDPEHIEIVGNMGVKMWQMGIKSKKAVAFDKDGKASDWDTNIKTKNMFAYKVAIRKKAITAIPAKLIEQWREALQTQSFLPFPLNLYGNKVSYAVMIADPQLGKERTTEAIFNWKRGVYAHAEKIQRLVDSGMDVEVAVMFMGDETEGVANNYANQAHTIELNLTEQLELDYDMTMWTLKTLLPLGQRRKVGSVRSNHGEWTRNGSKDVVTTKADNSSTFIRLMAQKTFAEIPGYEDVEWLIGNEGPHVLADLSGVPSFFSHFYEQKGKGGATEIRTRSAIERQIIGRTDELGDISLWFTAHYHHFYTQEWEGRMQFGCPALEAEKSSGYMLNQYGVWSPPGMLGLTVGKAVGSKGWGDLNVF